MEIVKSGPIRSRVRRGIATAVAAATVALLVTATPAAARVKDFPPGYTGYHTYAELTSALRATQRDHPDIASLRSIGKTHEGRELWMVKISDNVRADEDEPEVLFNCGQHAQEHLTVEMCLRVVHRLTTDPAARPLVDSREIWVIPSVNPDGAEYDINPGTFRNWRKNRQGFFGTDLNRNWAYRWGCCGGSSDLPLWPNYRGAKPFSAPESRALGEFVDSRVVGGKQQITAHVDFHTYGELVLWPYAHTKDDTAPGLTADEQRAFQALGQRMAATNGFQAQQSSDLNVTDGDIIDWMWARHRIWSYTFELYGKGEAEGGFYPKDTVIDRETARNDRAVDLLLAYADCVPRVVGGSCS
ncbi:murein tripeptide amidase MpaA [Crossiella equi]|uniref:Murein tripeptide amidase MpaA n=1 Tax=Crossiella equi TaxID=130796 RepID=A0ABS5ALL7_9PSEU|nr:M14 family metallopeptidase [Crossiella equi]MBP2477282.1 murein tripeptide amidase MpaA [Crossiella equi]